MVATAQNLGAANVMYQKQKAGRKFNKKLKFTSTSDTRLTAS